MQYGTFDDKRKEYVITRPDTPRSWTNCLGNTRYGVVLTNNAGGYSFFRSAAQGRITRARLNNIPMDQPGRYLYLRDQESGDYWSLSWQPVGKPLDQYTSECRHGAAYTIIRSLYSAIQAETTYFVPLDADLECWAVTIENRDAKSRSLRLFTYVEYPGNWNAVDDMINLQYTQYTLKMDMIDNIIDHGTNVFIPPNPDNFQQKDQGRHTFFLLNGSPITGFDTDRDAFIGPYRSYGNPLVVEQGACLNTLAAGDNGCSVLQTDITLQPGQSVDLVVVMGIGSADVEGCAARERFTDRSAVCEELEKLKSYWHEQIEGMTACTPDAEFNSMVNMWNPYNNLITYNWARTASLVYNGERDGLGYRDTVQDFVGIMQHLGERTRERLELVLTGQFSSGGAMPVIKPFAHYPGTYTLPEQHRYRSDDCLWLFNAIPEYLKETGNMAFLETVLPYADQGEATVYQHLRQALNFNLERLGAHGLPCGLHADWNDCLCLGAQGESVFVAFQLRLGLKTYSELSRMLGREEQAVWADDQLAVLDDNLAQHAWDGDWYLRAYRYDGLKFGSHECHEGQIFLNPQSWSIISGHASPERARKALQAVDQRLATEYGIMVCDPAYAETDPNVVRATLMNKGMKENGGIFNHTQGWAVMAAALQGQGELAYRFYRAFMPAAFNTKAEIRQIEPYVYSQSTHSRYSPRFGNARVPWLSGTATWANYSASHYLLGVRPEYDGLRIDPCIPAEWQCFGITRFFRGKRFDIVVENPDKVQKDVRKIVIGDQRIEGNLIPLDAMQDINQVRVIMGH